MRDPFRTYKTAWVDFAKNVGGEYTSYTHNMGARIIASEGPWKIVYTDYRTGIAGDYGEHTIVVAPFVTTHNLRLHLRRETLTTTLMNLVGLHNVQIGDPAFDSAYVVRGNDAAATKDLLSDGELRALLLAIPPIDIRIVDHEGWYTHCHTPEQGFRAPQPRPDVDVLHFHIGADIWEVELLMQVHRIATGLLHALVRIGAATAGDPDLSIGPPQA